MGCSASQDGAAPRSKRSKATKPTRRIKRDKPRPTSHQPSRVSPATPTALLAEPIDPRLTGVTSLGPEALDGSDDGDEDRDAILPANAALAGNPLRAPGTEPRGRSNPNVSVPRQNSLVEHDFAPQRIRVNDESGSGNVTGDEDDELGSDSRNHPFNTEVPLQQTDAGRLGSTKSSVPDPAFPRLPDVMSAGRISGSWASSLPPRPSVPVVAELHHTGVCENPLTVNALHAHRTAMAMITATADDDVDDVFTARITSWLVDARS